jgi:hypothetical protein
MSTPRTAPGARHRGPDLSSLESRLTAAAVTVPPFAVLFLLVLPLAAGLAAGALLYAAALWLAAGGRAADRRAARAPARTGRAR